jgi:hypothetical protein
MEMRRPHNGSSACHEMHRNDSQQLMQELSSEAQSSIKTSGTPTSVSAPLSSFVNSSVRRIYITEQPPGTKLVSKLISRNGDFLPHRRDLVGADHHQVVRLGQAERMAGGL